MNVYYRMNREEAAQKFNVKPLKLRWVDVNKARAGETPNIRCRLVAKEIKKDERPELFAGTPPLEALKILCRIASSRRKEYEMMHIDVSGAYFHAAAGDCVYLPCGCRHRLFNHEAVTCRFDLGGAGSLDRHTIG